MKTLLLAGTTVAALAAANLAPAMAQATKPVSQVVQWNQTLLVIVRTPGAQPATIHPTRSFAMMHAAIYDAVNSIDRTHSPYLVQIAHISRRASEDAAADTAGQHVLDARRADGSATPPPDFVFGTAPGDFQSTPPNFPKPQFTGWSQVTPFALE